MSIWKVLGPTVIPNSQTIRSYTINDVRVNVTGRITAIVIHTRSPSVIYVGTAQGGVWKTTNGGIDWTPTSDNELSLAIGALAMDPSNPEVLYAGTGEGNIGGDSMYGLGVLKTTNGGQTWELKAKGTFSNDRFFRIAVHPSNSNYIFAATRSGIYRSTDAGESWSRLTYDLPSGSKGTDIVLDPKNPDTAYAAFWSEYRSGIYRTTTANAATPSWTSLAVVVGRPFDCSRIALGISSSSPQRLYALLADRSDDIDMFYHTGDGGESWTPIQLPDTTLFGHLYPQSIGTNGSYNLDVAVNPKNPDIVYLLGTSIWKAVRDNNDQWNIKDVGSTIHADNHALAFNTLNNNIIYAGNDGGIYKSINGGDNWDDSINKGLSITQFEFMEQDPNDEKRIIAGTQDNGTVIYEGKPEFYHSADGDGGFVCIHPNNSQIVWHTFNGLRPEISTERGKFQTWKPIYDDRMKNGDSIFYPPMTLDKTNGNNIAIGGRLLYIDYSKGEGGWTDRIDLELPLIVNIRSHAISAINFVNSNLIYVGTNGGCVYRVTRSANKWTPQPIHSSPFPDRHVWDIATLPSDQNKIIAVVSGFDTPHVFRGEVSPDNNSAKWTDISGTGTGRLPDIPVNALAIDENDETTMYIGTDVGVFGTTDGGKNWTRFSEGLPNCQVYDMRLKFKSKYNQVLRAATHGRGMWERILHGLRMAWKGQEGRIYWSIFDGMQWSGQMRGTVETIASPALAEFKGKLYMAWTGVRNDFKIYWSTYDGMQWSDTQVLSDRGTNTSPALAEFKGKLYMAWTGFAGWKEEETRNIYWSTYDGTRWSGQQRLLEYEGAEATIASPALAEFKGKLYMAWTGYFSSNVKWSTFDGTVPPKPKSPWSPQQSIDSSPLGLTISPALAKFDGKLYMTWVGPEHNPRIYWSSFDETRWSPQQSADSFQTSASPALYQY